MVIIDALDVIYLEKGDTEARIQDMLLESGVICMLLFVVPGFSTD